MSRRWRVAIAAAAMVAGCLLVVPAAWGSYNVAASCTSNGMSVPCDGWKVNPLQLVWSWTPDSGSGDQGCITQSFSSDTATEVTCDVTGPAGSGGTPQDIDLEISNPTATPVPARPPDSNGWYNRPLVISFAGVFSFSGFSGCTVDGFAPNTSSMTYNGPEGPDKTVSATCMDNAGKSAPASYTLNYDDTPPTMDGAIPSRPPDHNGWYNHPVSFAFSGTDSISGIASCSRPTYSGPDTASAVVTGNCTDRAGNVATLPISLSYDSTPPTLDASASPGDGIVNLNWNATESVAPVTSVQIARSPRFNSATTSALHRGHSGSFRDTSVRNWVTYKYTIQAWDQAGNETIRTITVTPGPRLLGPANGARLTTPPTLRWTPIHSATYYNVQLFRGDGKVLSMWPAHAKLQLTRRWHFGGHLRRLKPGKYRWYVWPGYGRRSAARYGSMVGKGTFVVTSAQSAAAATVVYPVMRMLAPDAGR